MLTLFFLYVYWLLWLCSLFVKKKQNYQLWSLWSLAYLNNVWWILNYRYIFVINHILCFNEIYKPKTGKKTQLITVMNYITTKLYYFHSTKKKRESRNNKKKRNVWRRYNTDMLRSPPCAIVKLLPCLILNLIVGMRSTGDSER